MADANSTATNRDTFNRFYHLRALAMSAEALLNENADSAIIFFHFNAALFSWLAELRVLRHVHVLLRACHVVSYPWPNRFRV